MIAFTVDDMFSGRSAGAIIKSVKALDHRATVRVDLLRHLVEIEPTWSESAELSEAIGRAGFTPTEPVDILLPDCVARRAGKSVYGI